MRIIVESMRRGFSAVLIVLPVMLSAQQPALMQSQPLAAGTASSSSFQTIPSPSNQAISQTGLLPVYGVDLRVDPNWVDGAQFPSQSSVFPNSGTSAVFQPIWNALQAGGYNVLRMPLDVRDTNGSANRAANLSVWAKSNNVRLIFTMIAANPGQPIPANFPNKASDFVKALIGLLRANNGQYLANYSQIMAFQLETEVNHAGRHGGMKEAEALQLVLGAAHAFRGAEVSALDGSGLSATPLMASTSFDFDLVLQGAIAGGTMTDAAYNQAYQALKQDLSALAGSGDLDLIAVDWFAGSLGGGGVEKTPDLVKSLLADVPGKQLLLGTGFSTAFHSADEQARFLTTAFINLSQFRADSGPGCLFAGTIFREALNGKTPNPNPARSTLPGEVDKWDWNAKAAELAAMWTQGKRSDDMSWWQTKVENNMGLVTLQTDGSGNVLAANPSTAQQAMVQLASTVRDINSQMASPTPGNNSSSKSLLQAPEAPSSFPNDPNASGSFQQQSTAQPLGIQDSGTTSGASSAWNQPQQSAANSYVGAGSTESSQAGCVPGSSVPQQPSMDPNAQQPYGQPAATNCSTSTASSGMGQAIAGSAQQGVITLLTAGVQRLSGIASGTPGSGFNASNSGYNSSTSSNGVASDSANASPLGAVGGTTGTVDPSSDSSATALAAARTAATDSSASSSTPPPTGSPSVQSSTASNSLSAPTTATGGQTNISGIPSAPGTANGLTSTATNASPSANASSTTPVASAVSPTVWKAGGVQALPTRPGPGTSASQPNAAPYTASSSTGIPAAAGAQPQQSSSGLVRPGPNGALAQNSLPAANLPSRPGPGSSSNAMFSSSATLPGQPNSGAPRTNAAVNSSTNPGAYSDLSVAASDVHIRPAVPRIGQTAAFTALIRNLGSANAQGAVVIFGLFVNGRQVGASPPMTFNIAGQGSFQANWLAPIPAGQQFLVMVLVSARGYVNPAHSRAALAFATTR